MTEKLYSVQAFADLAGVTVRTLHYYDRNDLLKPSQRTAAGHRRYSADDLLRLQQILTLKFMGFSLRDIADLLQHPAYNLKHSLEIQKQAIDDQIIRLQSVSQAIQFIMHDMNDTPDWQQVIAVIAGLNTDESAKWLRRYFDNTQLQQLNARARQMSPEEMAAGQQAWRDIMTAFADIQHKTSDPTHPDAQALAAQCAELIASFTQGDERIRHSLEAMYSNFDSIPEALRMGDKALYEFVHQAMQHYERKNS